MVKANRTSERPPAKSKLGSGKPRPSVSKANAAGYAKRHSKKAKTALGQSSDVYEYTPDLSRRSKVKLDLDHDEAAEYGVGVDGDNGEEMDESRARLIGENGEDEMIDSGDDEEIDSDAAFEESDEERFAGFFSSKGKKKSLKKKKSSVQFADVDLNEDEDIEVPKSNNVDDSDSEAEEEEEEGEDDEFIDLLDVLDGRGEVDNGSDGENVTKPMKPKTTGRPDPDVNVDDEQQDDDDDDMVDDEPDSESEDGGDKFRLSPSDEDEDMPEALGDLEKFISTLDPSAKKRKAGDNEATQDLDRSRKQRRVTIKERTEAGTENEFRAQSSGSKLNLDDLLAPLSSQSTALQSLKKSTKALAPSSSKTKTLSAPLPQRAQERLDREAAYEQTKEEVDKWSGTMKRIREAEHLSFPLQAQPTGRVSNLELAAKFKPTTALESSVDALLKSAKLREEDIEHTEETMLQMNKLSVEEVAERRGELRKMRELMFRAEVKARRVGKIKSKTYRKIKRKERERLGEKLGENDGSDDEESRMKREVDRARERATLRHKHTGKWARQMKGREGEEGRREIEEMLARGEKLRRKIRGVGSEDESDENDDEDDGDSDLEGGIERIKQGAFDELKRIEMEDGSIRIEPNGKGKSIFDMKFMKDAMARQQQDADKVVDDFVKEMGDQLGAEDSEPEDPIAHNVDPTSGVVIQRIGGRVVYRPGATVRFMFSPYFLVLTMSKILQVNNQTLAKRPLGSLASDTSSVTLKSTDLVSPPASPEELRRPTVPLADTDEANPWLTPHDTDVVSKAPRKKNEVVVSKDSAAITKSKNKLKKQAKRREEEKAKAKDDATVEISMSNVLTLETPASASSSQPSKTAAPKAPVKASKHPSAANGVTVDDDSDVNSEIEEQEKIANLKGKGKAQGLKAFEQRELVALAFAGDNVVQDFEEAKKREIAADAPREVDTTIPGWGSWGGQGTRVAPPKPHRIKKIAGIDPTTRADYNKANIIISEKRDKKAAKYLVKDLPYPYTSKAQFERTMERPLGTEWNTRVAFQRGTLPRVVKKPGVIINPLEKLTQ
ncbi:Utp14 protein-domain-containing protein [Collybia nuda]|uniref:Utp14 protein-domain-containing protein n=1 Tax=Collybia nuda TaxID=64659 RepID=A0A9P5Y437_9AGAR|nr:Utp14 protein-domain-containing protein [Collybia nuda]